MNVHTYMASFYYQLYKKSSANLQFIITCGVPKIIMIELYKILIHFKEIEPIENLPESEKESLRTECQSTGLKFSNRQMNNSCRILHTLKNIQ